MDKRNIHRASGPSGDPIQHFPMHPSMSAARDAARQGGSGPPERHQPHGPGQNPHFHSTNRDGTIKKDGVHYEYPRK